MKLLLCSAGPESVFVLIDVRSCECPSFTSSFSDPQETVNANFAVFILLQLQWGGVNDEQRPSSLIFLPSWWVDGCFLVCHFVINHCCFCVFYWAKSFLTIQFLCLTGACFLEKPKSLRQYPIMHQVGDCLEKQQPEMLIRRQIFPLHRLHSR